MDGTQLALAFTLYQLGALIGVRQMWVPNVKNRHGIDRLWRCLAYGELAAPLILFALLLLALMMLILAIMALCLGLVYLVTLHPNLRQEREMSFQRINIKRHIEDFDDDLVYLFPDLKRGYP